MAEQLKAFVLHLLRWFFSECYFAYLQTFMSTFWLFNRNIYVLHVFASSFQKSKLRICMIF